MVLVQVQPVDPAGSGGGRAGGKTPRSVSK